MIDIMLWSVGTLSTVYSLVCRTIAVYVLRTLRQASGDSPQLFFKHGIIEQMEHLIL